MISDTDQVRWQGAIGRTETRHETLEAEPLRRFALAAGADPTVEDSPPPLAHWAFFLPAPQDAEVGSDGHPRRGDFLPPVPLPRRMFAGSAIQFAAPLVLGSAATLVSRITEVSHKKGRSGDLVFVEVDRTIEQAGLARVHERQRFVYRGDGLPASLPVPAPDTPEGDVWQPDETNLFRFSAATFNSHRIHYDQPYARKVEGYPALVVHGPFTATKLAALALRGGPISRFAFRAMAPLFAGQPIYLRVASAGSVEAVRCDGVVAMQADFDPA